MVLVGMMEDIVRQLAGVRCEQLIKSNFALEGEWMETETYVLKLGSIRLPILEVALINSSPFTQFCQVAMKLSL